MKLANDNASAAELATQLANKLSELRPVGIYSRITSAAEVTNSLHHDAGQLVYGLNSNYGLDELQLLVSRLEADLQNATVLGKISDSELQSYLHTLDTIQDLITQEKI